MILSQLWIANKIGRRIGLPIFSLLIILILISCSESEQMMPDPVEDKTDFYFGADLSYVNQILDKGGVYKDSSAVESPYTTFAQYGTNLARFRLWHNPSWVKGVYNDPKTILYSGYNDVENSIRKSKNEGMEVLLDFHYSDDWADPGHQKVPEAWKDIRSIDILSDSIYNYTYEVLSSLNSRGLMPELVQIGNETNCGMFYSDMPTGFPNCRVCDGHWPNFRKVVKSAIRAVREVSSLSSIKTKIIFHVADPVNVDWWFSNLMNLDELTDFDIIGFSYYPLWHKEISVDVLKSEVVKIKRTFGKDVMVLETAYPWTIQTNDNYGNLFGSGNATSGFPVTPIGHQTLMTTIAQNLIDAGAIGMVYWEPAWITSGLKDRWGTGSSWENNSFYDYDGESNSIFGFMNYNYTNQ